MRKHSYCYFILLAVVAVTMGCTQQDQGAAARPSFDSTDIDLRPTFCGSAELMDVQTAEGRAMGIFELQNDAKYLWITFTPVSGTYILSIALFVGDPKDCPRQINGKPDPEHFPIQLPDLRQQFPWSARIPLKQLSPCIFAAARFRVGTSSQELEGELQSGRRDSIIPGMRYCVQPCDTHAVTCDLDDPAQAPRTVPQDEWATAGELASLLREKFDTLYPKGLKLGCNSLIFFMSAEKILRGLPMTGKPEKLLDTGASNSGRLNNQLLGELLTLEIAMRLDAHIPEFSPGEIPLGDLQVAKGAFEGWTLEELLQEGNHVLGGCMSNYNPVQIAEVLQYVNASFAKGNPRGRYLRCPTK